MLYDCNRWKIVTRPGLFADLANTTTELPSHPVNSATFHLNPTRLHTSPGTLNSSTNFLWGNRLFMLGAICNRWKVWLEPRAFRWPCEHSTTELPSHPVISATTFHLNPTRLHDYTKHFVFVHEIPVGKSTYFLYPSTKDIQTKPPLISGLFMLGAICNRWKSVTQTHGLSLTVQTLYHWATKPPGHLSNNFSPKPYPVTWLH